MILGAGLLAFVSLLISDDESEGSDAIGQSAYRREGVDYGLKILACWILGAGVGGLSREITRGGYVVALLALALITGLCMGALSSHKAKTRRRSIFLAAVALSAAAALSFFAGGLSFSSAFVGQLLGVMLVAGVGSWGYFGLVAEKKAGLERAKEMAEQVSETLPETWALDDGTATTDRR
ncbi:MAG: hypothetical protein JXA57_10250 [Armatimonadetes bacterium]|nr:hypothetical protein [Armatimonadota bacterium]